MNTSSMLQLRVVQAAVKWWESHRPLAFSEQEHLANPTINMCGDLPGQHALARAVSSLIKESWQADEARKLVQDFYDLVKETNRIDKAVLLRRAEVLLGKREVVDLTAPIARKRSLPRRLGDASYR